MRSRRVADRSDDNPSKQPASYSGNCSQHSDLRWSTLDAGGLVRSRSVTAVKRTVPDSPARLNADCGLRNEANRCVGEARNVATTIAQSFPKATPLYIQPQAVTASWMGFLISPVSKRYLYCCPMLRSSVKPYAATNSI